MYNQYQQQSQLPRPADRVITELYVHQAPPPPPVRGLEHVPIQTVYDVHTALVNVIQTESQKSAVRTFMFNLYAEYGYNNPMYQELLGKAVEYAVILKRPPADAASQTAMFNLPSLCQQYPQLMGYLSAEQQRSIEEIRQKHNEVSAAIRSGSHQQPHQQYQGQYPQHQQPSHVNYYGGQGQMRPMSHGGYPQQGMYQGMQPPFGGGRPQMAQPRPMNQFNSSTPMNMSGMTYNDGRNQQSNVVSNARPSMFDHSAKRPESQSPPPSVASATPREPFKTTLDPTGVMSNNKDNSMNHVDETTQHIAHGMARLENVETDNLNAKDPVFKTRGHIPFVTSYQFYVKNEDGGYTVYEKDENDMNYAEHEMDPGMVKLSKSLKAAPKVVPRADWSAVCAASSIGADDSTETVKELKASQSVFITDDLLAYSLPDAIVKSAQYLAGKGVKNVATRVVESYPTLETPVLVNKDDFPLFEDLMKANTVTEFVDQLRASVEAMGPRLYHYIQDRVTAITNRRLTAGLNTDIQIENIADDYEDMINALDEDGYNGSAIDRFKANLMVCVKNALKGEVVQGVLKLQEKVSITQLPWSSDDVDLQVGEGANGYGLLHANADESFYAACNRIYKRTSGMKGVPVSRRYIVTADNVWLELHVGDLGTDTLIINRLSNVS